MPIAFNEINEKANGGTELMARKLQASFTKEELDHVQIIPSRIRELDDTRARIFWCHDLPQDKESEPLANGGWKKFDKIVFVSHWQKQQYMQYYNIASSYCTVLGNAINPIENIVKPDINEKIKIVYHTTPHRGLELAYYAIDLLSKKFPTIEFNVFSSFQIYGWEERNKQYDTLFERIANHDNMVYHGTVSNEDVKKAVAESHIFAYPSIWQETSCISLMEAMSGKCLCVHPDLAALPETAANWTYMYNFDENPKQHLALFTSCLENAIIALLDNSKSMETRLLGQKSYVDLFYNWELRKQQWGQLLEAMKEVIPSKTSDATKESYQEDEFVYSA